MTFQRIQRTFCVTRPHYSRGSRLCFAILLPIVIIHLDSEHDRARQCSNDIGDKQGPIFQHQALDSEEDSAQAHHQKSRQGNAIGVMGADGVDGLCGSVSAIEFVGYAYIFKRTYFSAAGLVFAFILVAYLAYNWNPSKVLMGDAGSRTIGFWMAILAMMSGHPFSFLLMSLVFIFDGGLGLLRLVLLRLTKSKVTFLKNVRFPFHDQLRKNMGWKVPYIALFFAGLEIVFVVIMTLIIKQFGL